MSDALFVRMTETDGTPIYPDALYAVDDRGLPVWSERRPEGDGVYAVRCPASESFTLIVLWEVPDFGRVTRLRSRDATSVA